MINLIIGTTPDHGIGMLDGSLPWHAPTDMARFKRLTMGNAVLMGRATWESIPEQYRPLTGRTNIVLTNDKNYVVPVGVLTTDDLFGTLNLYKDSHMDVFVIGGASVYDEVMAAGIVNRAFITIMQQGYPKQPEVFTKIQFANYQSLLHGSLAGTKYRVEFDETDEPINEPMMTFIDLVRIS